MYKIIPALQGISADLNHIFIGVSGGPDSVFLLHSMVKSNEKSAKVITVLHFDHGLRKNGSVDDRKFVESLAKDLGVKFISGKPKTKPSGSIEAWARGERYAFFKEQMAVSGSATIFLGHNADDILETFLMKILSGKGADSVFSLGPRATVDGLTILRPLWKLSKESIIFSLKESSVPYRIDHSNDDDAFTRNYLRNRVIPLLRERFSGCDENFLNFYSSAKDLISREREQMTPFYKALFSHSLGVYRAPLPKEITGEYFEALKMLGTDILGIPHKRFNRSLFEELRKHNATPGGSYLKISENYYIFKGYAHLCVLPSVFAEKFSFSKMTINDGSVILRIPFAGWVISGIEDTMNIEVFHEGDHKKSGTKISDIFKKKRIDGFLRGVYPVIKEDGIVVAVPGLFNDATNINILPEER
ncbi:tRNA lysidine(34) synthetase TilS [bacterium]|nr:tRNA lysidine(34) synthetase TilS [bacterium]